MRAHGEERGVRSEQMVPLVPSRSEARRGEVYIGLENPTSPGPCLTYSKAAPARTLEARAPVAGTHIVTPLGSFSAKLN